MSTLCRFANSKIVSCCVFYNKPYFLTLSRPVTLKAIPYKVPVEEDHDERNAQLNRPQSPHLSIYKIELTSTLSISHRMTGAVLGGYCFLLGGGALILPDQMSHYIDALQNLHPGPASLFAMKFMLAFPFTYHFCNGIRHLIWDLGKFLTNDGVNKTGYVMLGTAFVTTIALSTM